MTGTHRPPTPTPRGWPDSPTYEGRPSEATEATSTGRSTLSHEPRLHRSASRYWQSRNSDYSPPLPMSSSPAAQQQETTSGRTTPPSQTPDSSMAHCLFDGTSNTIGIPSGKWLRLDGSWRCHPRYGFATTPHSDESPPTTPCPKRYTDKWMFFGASPAQASQETPGQQLDSTPSPRTPEPNFGTDTKDSNTSSSMSSEETSTSHTCSDGSIGTPSSWRSKAAPLCCEQLASGSPATWTPDSGTNPSMPRLGRLFYADVERLTMPDSSPMIPWPHNN